MVFAALAFRENREMKKKHMNCNWTSNCGWREKIKFPSYINCEANAPEKNDASRKYDTYSTGNCYFSSSYNPKIL